MKKRKEQRSKKKNNRKNNFNKIIIRISFILTVFLLVMAGLFILDKIEKRNATKESGEFGTVGPFSLEGYGLGGLNLIKPICDDDGLKQIWGFIFKESSNGITIVTNKDSAEKCNLSLMYKVLDNNLTYFIFLESQYTSRNVSVEGYGLYGNFSDAWVSGLRNATSANLDQFGLKGFISSGSIDMNLFSQENVQGIRSLSSNECVGEYNQIFNIPDSEWGDALNSLAYSEVIPSSNFSISKKSTIMKNKAVDMVSYIETLKKSVSINQTNQIINLILGNGSIKYYDIIDLNNYFSDLSSDVGFSYAVFPSGIGIEMNGSTNKLNIDTSSSIGGSYRINISLSYQGINITSNNFNVTFSGCLDSDNGQNSGIRGSARNLSDISNDSCIDANSLNEYYCVNKDVLKITINCSPNSSCLNGACTNASANISNQAPLFLGLVCGKINLTKDSSYNIDMRNCFRDFENNSLILRYENTNTNLTIARAADVLVLIPNTGWVGQGFFFVYANDSYSETSGRVNFSVLGEGFQTGLQIRNPSPFSISVSIAKGKNQSFSIEGDYESIKWYVNNQLVKTNSLDYEFRGSNVGNYSIKVEVKNGEETETRTWELFVEKPENPSAFGNIMFYLITISTLIVIVIVLWLFFRENSKKHGAQYGFGVSGVKISGRTSRNDFNIPGNE